MEVKIGIRHCSRELVFTSTQTAEEVEKLLMDGVVTANVGLLGLSDEKGRRYLIDTTHLGYVEIGVADDKKETKGRIGFPTPPPPKEEEETDE